MASIILCGGGPIGLLTSVMFARDGHRVTILENDPQSTPDQPVAAWESRERRGVAQFGSRTTCSPGSGSFAWKRCGTVEIPHTPTV